MTKKKFIQQKDNSWPQLHTVGYIKSQMEYEKLTSEQKIFVIIEDIESLLGKPTLQNTLQKYIHPKFFTGNVGRKYHRFEQRIYHYCKR